MKIFASWSGGKDCMLAVYRVLQQKEHEVAYLLNMCDENSTHSRSHEIEKQLIEKQANSLGIEIIQPQSSFDNYKTVFMETVEIIKKQGVTGGIFGDIYLREHRDWIENVCAELSIQPFFPLWGCDTAELLSEFINSGFKTKVVAVNNKFIPQSWLGRDINNDFLRDILQIEGIDPCAENGEYHSFVYDGPIFKNPIKFAYRAAYQQNNHWYINLQ